jgi:hypothetical protein
MKTHFFRNSLDFVQWNKSLLLRRAKKLNFRVPIKSHQLLRKQRPEKELFFDAKNIQLHTCGGKNPQ